MLLDILKKLSQTVKERYDIELDNNQIQMLSLILKNYNKSILPIDVVKDNINLTYEQTNKLLKILAINGILDLNYRIWCDEKVNKPNDKIYTDILSIPEEVCEYCDKKCMIYKNIIVVYRVNLDDIQ